MAFRSQRRSGSSIFLGVIATLLASLAFTLSSACARMLEPGISSGEMTFFRGVFGLLLIPLLCLQTGEKFFTGHHKVLLSLRGFFGSCGLWLYLVSIEGLTLGDSQILAQTSAFFMCLLSPLFLSEKLPREAVPGLLAITVGTLLVVRIWDFSSFNIYALYGLACGLASAAAYITISLLAEKNFRANTEIVFYFQIYSILIGLFLMAGDFVMPRGAEWLWLAGLGAFALAAQMFMTWAFQHANSIIVSFLMYSEILFHALFGWLFWEEIMTPASWAGGALIVLGSILLMVFKKRPIESRDTHHHAKKTA